MISHSRDISESWQDLPWKKFRKIVFRIQKRIYQAVQAGDKAKARNLQKLLMRSYAARMLAIRQVTQLNSGKRTAGIDGKTALKFTERFELEKVLSQKATKWKHQALRQIPISKKNGKVRMLKIPTISDRAWQCIVKFALEPAHEATFHARSYGFRTGRSAHDAQKFVFVNLNSNGNGINKRVIELDIEKCFDRISHKAILDRVIAPQAIKMGLYHCLKAGINPEYPEQGTPQGGVCSPLLANIALNGIESIHHSVRYADDMLFFLKPNDNAEEILEKVKQFLAERGMQISQEKTKVTASTEGFDFLGWNFKVQTNGKFRSKPSEDNYKAFRQKVKEIVNCSNYGAELKSMKLAPIIRGWRNYHRYCKMDEARNSLWYMEKRAWKVFNKETKLKRYSTTKLIEKAFPRVSYSENRFVMVTSEKSPFNGEIAYWSKRKSLLYDGATAKALNKQNHSCGHCGYGFMDEERIHLHHLDGNHSNWKPKNLMAIHESCHDYLHMGKKGIKP